MAEVLSGITSLFGGGANPSTATGASVMGKGLLKPDILAGVQDLGIKPQDSQDKTTNPIFSESTIKLMDGVKEQAQKNLQTAMPMMQLHHAPQQPQIQQLDLVNLLRTLGGSQ